MSSKPKLSVVIATHNNIEHLGECLDSVMCQAFSDIEVILVDVLSTDGTKELIEETARNDERVVFLADSYGSLGRARNAGIDRARAPYIIFVEPEDYIDDDMLAYFYDAMEDEPELDLIACGVDGFGDGSYGETNKDKKRRIGEANKAQDNRMQMDSRVFRFHVFESVCVYRRSFLDDTGIRFYDMPGYGKQDAAFKFLTMLRAKTMVSDGVLYYRRMELPEELVKDSRNILDVCHEYQYLREQLQKDKDLWWRIRFTFWQAYYASNMELYGKLSEDLKPSLSKRMQGDLLQAIRQKELNRDNLDILIRDEILLLLKSTNEFDEYQKNKTWNQEKDRVETIDRNERIAKRAAMQYEEEDELVRMEMDARLEAERKKVDPLDKKWLMDEMGRDMAPLRLLLGLSQEEMGGILGVSGSTYKSMEAGKKEVSWDQYLALLFLFRYNDRTVAVTDTLGLYPESLELRMKKGIVGNIVGR